MGRIIFALFLLALPAQAQDVAELEPRDGWAVYDTAYDFATLV